MNREEIDHLHRPFIRWLRQERLGFLTPRSDRKSTIAEGAHDFTVFVGGPFCVCIEFKAKDGKLSDAQRAWADSLAHHGTTVHVLRDIEAAVALVQLWRDVARDHVARLAPAAAKQDAGLVRWKNGVFRRLADGSLAHVRPATDADASIPSL